MTSKMTRTESLVGEFSRNLVGGVKPTRKDVLLQAEQNKKDSHRFNLPISDNRVMLLQELRDNFATWNLNQSFAILDDKIVLEYLTRFLSDVKEVSSPTAKKSKKDDFLNSLGEFFPFYQEITVPDVDMQALPPGPSRPIRSSSLTSSNFDDDYSLSEDEDEDSTPASEADPTSSVNERNCRDLSRFAKACEEAEVSDYDAAKLATALMMDLGIVSPNNLQEVIDRQKIRRARERVVNEIDDSFTEQIAANKPTTLYFDSKIIYTNYTDRDGKRKKRPIDIYVLCTEKEEFLDSFEMDGVPGEVIETKAKRVAQRIYEIIVKWGLQDSLQAIGGDTTNMNTGWKGGVFLFLEQKLGRRLFRIECQLHLNELPMRKLAKYLIGKSQSGVRLRGKIFSNILIATSLPVSNDFEQISCEDFFDLDPKVLQDLSSDQKYCYQIWKVIVTGCEETRMKVANLEVGPASLSRWLTLCCRAARVYISDPTKTNLTQTENRRLFNFVKYLVRVYFPNWFLVKSNSDITKGSTNLLKFLELFRKWEPTGISEDILNDVRKNIIRNAYWSCPQKIILGLVTHDDEERRREGIKLILDIRKKYPQENSSTRAKRYVNANLNATSLLQLTKKGNFRREPVFTLHLSEQELWQLLSNKLVLPRIPGHSQACERMIRRMTESAAIYWTEGRRKKHIRARQYVKKFIPKNRTKRDLVSFVNGLH